MNRSSFVTPLFFAGALCVSCGAGDEAPQWIELARGHRPTSIGHALEASGNEGVTWDAELGGVWIESALHDESWQEERHPGAFRAVRPPTPDLGSLFSERLRLDVGGRKLRHITAQKRGDEWLEVGTFATTLRDIIVQLGPGEVPENVRFAIFLELGSITPQGAWRLSLGGRTADGISLWPGVREVVSVDVPPASRLRFHALARALNVRDPGADASARFTVWLDDEPLASFDEGLGESDAGTWHELDLPPDASEGQLSRISFLVEGEGVLAGILAPTIGPATVGRPATRPWAEAGETRPDILVFLADTFRADNLALHGGPVGLTPSLDALASSSVRFLEARATATSTLPSHGSFFTGLQPPQHTAIHKAHVLPDELTTVAEHLRGHGYRTVAVTDAGFVSRAFGMDQGFEWFMETSNRSLARTLRASLEVLERDDGRPTFLFVQTYRTHTPYRTGADEDESAWRELMVETGRRMRERQPGISIPDTHKSLSSEWHALYREGVRAMDEELAPWLHALDERDFYRHGALLFTSDHGEAFWEHDEREHGGVPWDEVLRVPLLLRADWLDARDVTHPVSLLDLPCTLADLAGIVPAQGWDGGSLLKDAARRPVFAYSMRGETEDLAIIRGSFKVHADCTPENLANGLYRTAFDLSTDADEAHDLAAQDPTWAATLCRELADEVQHHLVPRVDLRSAELADGVRQDLDALGY